MILVDTGGLYAALDRNEPLHEACVSALLTAPPPRLLSPFVLAELDYLVATRLGSEAEATLLNDVANGAYQLEPFDAEDVRRATRVIERYSDHNIGLADASIVVLAERHRVWDLLTTDQRHFRTVRGPLDRAFRILPFDD